MRAVVFAVVVLHAAAASAQIAIGEEAVSDPLQIHASSLSLAAPAVAIAQDNTGVAVAWSMARSSDFVERVYVARLDAAGHALAPVREMPLSAPGHAVYPSLAAAPGGDGFLLAWLEIDPPRMPLARSVFTRLDAALTPSAPSVLSAAVQPTAPPLVRTKGDTAWIAAGTFLWTLSKDGRLSGPLGGFEASDMTIATDLPQIVGGRSVKSNSFTCKGDSGCIVGHTPPFAFCRADCQVFSFSFSLDFASLLTMSVSTSFNFATDARPAMASNGRDVLVAWFHGAQAGGGDVVAVRAGVGDLLHFGDLTSQPAVLAQFPADIGETRPAIAADGQHYVVVWRSRTAPGNHDVVGIAVDNDGNLTPLSIASSSADERDPAVLALGGGTFLVAYEKVTGTERRLAGRFVTFGRRRAAR